ncbi:MAG: hypothetical protein KIT31_33530 [Deltaproteobacteria bacterium]|nr:hypothetical protein [Deltaproteobacteria bacterium]
MHQQAESVGHAPWVTTAVAVLAISALAAWLVHRDPRAPRTVQRSHSVTFELDVWMLPHVDTSSVEVFRLR